MYIYSIYYHKCVHKNIILPIILISTIQQRLFLESFFFSYFGHQKKLEIISQTIQRKLKRNVIAAVYVLIDIPYFLTTTTTKNFEKIFFSYSAADLDYQDYTMS